MVILLLITYVDLNALPVLGKVLGEGGVELGLVRALAHVPDRVVVDAHLRHAVHAHAEQHQRRDQNADLRKRIRVMPSIYFAWIYGAVQGTKMRQTQWNINAKLIYLKMVIGVLCHYFDLWRSSGVIISRDTYHKRHAQ